MRMKFKSPEKLPGQTIWVARILLSGESMALPLVATRPRRLPDDGATRVSVFDDLSSMIQLWALPVLRRLET